VSSEGGRSSRPAPLSDDGRRSGPGVAGDPELAKLLLDELRKHAPALDPGAPVAGQRQAVHALKGSAGIAGERALAESLARIERRLLAADPEAAADAHRVVTEAMEALAAGRAPALPSWPEPPADLRALPLDAAVAERYRAEMQDRLARVDDALAASGDDGAAVLSAFRDVHAMKGAAHAVADEVTAWFCHGLEERLRAGQRSADDARLALAELTRWRGVLAELIVAPERALPTLRLLAHPQRLPSLPPPESTLPPRRASQEPPSDLDGRGPLSEDATLRVPTATVDRLFERVRLLGQSRSKVVDGAVMAGSLASLARGLRLELAEALRLIGPPRPWGAPAAAIRRVELAAREIGNLAERLERGAADMKETAERVGAESAGAHGDLAAMRTVRVGWLFERVAAAVSAQARREGQEVRLAFSGEDAAIDRRVAEQLFDPVLQLARNAVVHGIEPAPERAMRGKPRLGAVHLGAQARSGGLRLVVQDDGAGVDVADVRRRAVARGTISAEMAGAADDQTLLSLLFVPGFTTRDSADLLAGRGVGLDLALEAVHRLGGTIRLASRPGMGLTATLDIPFEPGVIKVLWLEAEGETFALPIQQARRILLGRDPDAAGAVPLLACVRGSTSPPSEGSRQSSRPPVTAPPAAFVVELEPLRADFVDWGSASGSRSPPPPVGTAPERPTVIGVDRIGAIEEVTLRAILPLIATAGPYAGAVVRGAELRLCLDAHALADAAAAWTRRAEPFL
jgi:two-component system chemotaxis sensor kinase CheA